ncbi:MAG: UDP-N-acetylmuramate dehydrogenase [Desulfuromonadaceae bacterium]
MAGKLLAAEPMSRHTTWRVGGPADLFLEPADQDDLERVLRLLQQAGVPWLAVGSGSNLLVRDGGIRGAVIHLRRFRQLEMAGDGRIRAGGGLPLMTLIRETSAGGWAGLEGLAGIPGTVGGAVAMNAGAGGQEMADVVESAVVVTAAGAELWSRERLQFAYRHSALSRETILTSASMRFRPGEAAALGAVIRERLAARRSTQRVGGPNAGSVFKNPPGQSAWQLIAAAGMRGMAIGDAQIAEGHANFIVNRGRARARDILQLIEQVRERVREASGIELETEIRIVGADAATDEKDFPREGEKG